VQDYYCQLQASKKVKENHEKERKKIMMNSQLFAGFPLFRITDYNPRDREFIYKRMQNMMYNPSKYFV
jgi:hypothetical protein